MAIIESDGVHNSLGIVVHYMRKGKKVLRLKTANYHDPKTPKQLAHREKMRLTGEFTGTCKKFLNIGYQAAPTEMDCPSNEARSYILKNCFDYSGTLPVLDYSKVLISRGHIAAPELTTVTIEGSNLTINWKTPVRGDNNNGDDRVMIMFYATKDDDRHCYTYTDVAMRSHGTVSVKIPSSITPLHFWIFFHNPNAAISESRMKISDSVYICIT